VEFMADGKAAAPAVVTMLRLYHSLQNHGFVPHAFRWQGCRDDISDRMWYDGA
jgi:hypothetical protein